jgi:ubiquitin
MYGLRERLLQAQAAQNSEAQHELSQYQNEASRLAAAIAKLEGAEDQLRTLQATLIAERVERTQIERDARSEADSMKDCKTELAGAIRALRRARDEGKKTEEERRKLARAFEDTKVQWVQRNSVQRRC